MDLQFQLKNKIFNEEKQIIERIIIGITVQIISILWFNLIEISLKIYL